MQAGKLNRRVTIEKHDTGTDDWGQPVDTWVEVAKPWANIKHLSGAETIRDGVDASVVKASIRIRYRTNILPGMRVVHGSTVYDIKAVMPDAAGKVYCDLVCEVTQ